MEKLKLTICYHCHALADHLKPDCPYLKGPQFCSRCGQRGHPAWSCKDSPHCLHCEGEHPANARICPIYREKFKETFQKALEQSRDSDNFSPPNSLPAQKSPQSISDSAVTLTEAVTASLTSTYTPKDFINALFFNLKASSPPPQKLIPASLTYTDWEFEENQSDFTPSAIESDLEECPEGLEEEKDEAAAILTIVKENDDVQPDVPWVHGAREDNDKTVFPEPVCVAFSYISPEKRYNEYFFLQNQG